MAGLVSPREVMARPAAARSGSRLTSSPMRRNCLSTLQEPEEFAEVLECLGGIPAPGSACPSGDGSKCRDLPPPAVMHDRRLMQREGDAGGDLGVGRDMMAHGFYLRLEESERHLRHALPDLAGAHAQPVHAAVEGQAEGEPPRSEEH